MDKKNGFTLLELMIAGAILTVALGGIIAAFSGCFTLNEGAKNLTLAIAGSQKKLAEIHNTNFDLIFTNYNGVSFEIPGLPDADSEGTITVDNTDLDLLKIIVTICWRQKGGRVFGEDTDLDGTLDIGEDTNMNKQIDSPCQLITLISRS